MSGELLGRDQLVRNLSTFQGKFLDHLLTAVEMTQAEVATQAQQNHPFTTRSGQLEHSIQPGKVTVTDKSIGGEVVADKSYASFVELGTSRARPFPYLYPALASKAEALRNRIKAVMQHFGGKI